ncbi:unnamed protein product (macronuclear) [Paramecium tetraurelia]|uniref:Uncharacterized protein n=1 Tax=Paramecium tetraurelia TaxID=5888 RepID=A0DXH6_PARTE|nr:uncharacterized protein GSPATT00021376001 [Paramecium tetraurelia]CAK87743.1 unnamed protein product [Paramecium tetraurelia]|eukprot:XP_001455140.1 hypothetical protein (macronuclear) [Paramecium tetraurelia strain d4-2]
MIQQQLVQNACKILNLLVKAHFVKMIYIQVNFNRQKVSNGADENDDSLYFCIRCERTAINDIYSFTQAFHIAQALLHQIASWRLQVLIFKFIIMQRICFIAFRNKRYKVFQSEFIRRLKCKIDSTKFSIIVVNNCLKPYLKALIIRVIMPQQNRIYCFEYQDDKSSLKSTLYKDLKSFNIDQKIQIGCSICEDGFIFDFTLGNVQENNQKIQTYLRSFFNFDGIEICTLSAENNFTVAPEIVNCDKYISFYKVFSLLYPSYNAQSLGKVK